jgi:hypothetical protein
MKFHSCSIGGIIYSDEVNDIKKNPFEKIINDSLNLKSPCCEFVLVLALCHSVIRETETGNYILIYFIIFFLFIYNHINRFTS